MSDQADLTISLIIMCVMVLFLVLIIWDLLLAPLFGDDEDDLF